MPWFIMNVSELDRGKISSAYNKISATARKKSLYQHSVHDNRQH